MQEELRALRKKPFKERFLGNKDFYKMVLAIVLPIIVQNGISTFVNLLDNVMVGLIGTEQMSGVSVANNLFFVFNLALFGAMSGVGIFTVQYYGCGDTNGLRKTVRFKLWIGLLITVVGIVVLTLFSSQLVNLYLHDESGNGNAEATLQYGLSYIRIIILSLPAFMIVQVYASTLRECSETKLPMVAGITAVCTNLLLNYLLIYGKLGLPKLGVQGAAIATVISRYVEMLIVVIWAHKHTDRQPWAAKLYQSMRVPVKDIKRFTLRGFPLFLNELLWSLGVAMVSQCYSLRGLEVIAATNIANNLTQFTNILTMSMGSAVGIIIGQLLGAGKMIEAKDTDNKLVAFSLMLSVISTGALLILAPLFPNIYNTTDEIKQLATSFMYVTCVITSFDAFTNVCYFTLRSGGKTVLTFIFDCVSMWVLMVPVAYVLCHFTALPIVTVYICVNATHIIKADIGYVFLRRNIWINNIVEE